MSLSFDKLWEVSGENWGQAADMERMFACGHIRQHVAVVAGLRAKTGG
jgi:hypothetical protein